MINWNNFDNQTWRYLWLENFGGVMHDIPKNV